QGRRNPVTEASRVDMRSVCIAAAAIVGAGLVGAATGAGPASAQNYPDRVIKLVVPAGPAGPTDMLGRLIADRLTASLGQPVIVDNRGGAGGALGARAVAAAEPDGY